MSLKYTLILKLTDVFEIHAHFKMIILKLEQMFLNYVIQNLLLSNISKRQRYI